MSQPITAQQYAALADDAYTLRPTGMTRPDNEKSVVIDGVSFKIVDHYDNPKTGYQGTIYQNMETGQFVVAHRGTEFDREPRQDGVSSDGGMVLARANAQADEALLLTRKAKVMAEEFGKKQGIPTPDVTVTGHSLGGTLAQITAYKEGLRGEAFNPYGAVSLRLGIPEGGNRFTNHVMAGDAVSAASLHYGRVHVYAKPEEVALLYASGYGRFNPTPNQPVAAAAATGVSGSHNMDNFLPVDAKHRPDVSVLDSPSSRRIAEEHARTIGEYRSDIHSLRGTTSVVGDVLRWLNDPHADHNHPKRDMHSPSTKTPTLDLSQPLTLDDYFKHLHRSITSGDPNKESQGLAMAADSKLGQELHAQVRWRFNQQEEQKNEPSPSIARPAPQNEPLMMR